VKVLHLNFVPVELLGVKNKIAAQIKAFKNNNIGVDSGGYSNKGYFISKKRIFPRCFSSSFIRKIAEIYILLRLIFINYNKYDVVYIRYMRLTPWFYLFIKTMKKNSFKLILEVPTYPYDEEYSRGFLSYSDQYFRNKIVKYVDYITYFGGLHDEIWGIQAIKLENGIDLDSVPLKKDISSENKTVHFIGVANLSEWHAYDRLIKSISESENPDLICFDIVGMGPSFDKLVDLTDALGLQNFVKFHKLQFGANLNRLFDKAHIGVGSLGLHRIGHDTLTPLKPAEYTARGIPFILGNSDDRFLMSKFIYRVPNDDSTFKVDDIISWYKGLDIDSKQIRKYADENLSWNKQIADVFFKIK